ncbi:iron dicitrate transport regulator FecR, partial [Bacteroides ovatus]
MMKDTKTEKDKLHRYLDDLYTRDDASQLLQSIKDSENQDILDELAAEVWEESGNLQPANDLDREKYKREAR